MTAIPQPPPIPVPPSGNMKNLPLAGLGKRGLAAGIDHLLLYIVLGGLISFTTPLWVPMLEPLSEMIEQSVAADYTNLSPDSVGWMSLVRLTYYFIIAFSAVFCLYFVPEIFWGTTPGKKLLKLRIVTVDGQHSFNSRFLRWIGKFSIIIIQLIALIFSANIIRAQTIDTSNLPGISVLLSIGNLLTLLYVAGCCTIFGKNKQTFYDMMSKTVVVQES